MKRENVETSKRRNVEIVSRLNLELAGLVWGLMVAMCSVAVAQPQRPAPIIPQRFDPQPAELTGVDVDEHLGAQIPLDLTFVDEQGKTVKLSDYFNSGRPVILNLAYYRCPMLCSLIMNGMTDALKQLEWNPGQQYEVLTVSFDPGETEVLANLKKQNYITEFGRPEAAAGWHFLTGKQEQITALTQAVGFQYRWDDGQNQFVHPSVLIVGTPDGKISRYLYGVLFNPRNVKLALLEASEGKVGSTTDRLLLYCFHYDPRSNSYTLAADMFMKGGAAVTVAILAIVLLPRWVRDYRKRARA